MSEAKQLKEEFDVAADWCDDHGFAQAADVLRKAIVISDDQKAVPLVFTTGDQTMSTSVMIESVSLNRPEEMLPGSYREHVPTFGPSRLTIEATVVGEQVFTTVD